MFSRRAARTAARRPADPRPGLRRPDHLRREGPRHLVPADRAAAAARRRAQRADRADRRRRVRAPSSAFGGPCNTPTAERLAANGLKYNRFHTTALCSPDAAGAAHRPQPPLGRHGRDHRDRDVGARLQLDPAEHGGAAGRDAQAQRLLHRPVRQVPRGAGLGDEPDGPVRRLADRIGASSTSTASSAARRTSTRRRSTRTRCRSSRTARRRRATTSPRT